MRIKENSKYLSIILLMIIMISSSSAQYVINNSVVGNGFGAMANTDKKINSTTGQPFIGKISNISYINQSGFWYSSYLMTSIEDINSILPGEFKLYQNFPNPFNPITHIKYTLPKASLIKIEIFNGLGQKLKTLVDAHQKAGFYTVDFNGSQFASGLYFYRIVTNEFSKVHKMILMK